MDTDFDLIVVGAGVAGAMIAARIAREKKHKILLLEAGTGNTDRWQRVEQYVDTYTKIPSAPYRDEEAEKFAPFPIVIGDTYYKQTSDQKFKSTYPRRLGGSTWHFLGNTPRFVPTDFRMKTEFGRSEDWPIDYDTLEEWYCQAETEMGVSGDHHALNGMLGAHRSAPFPMPKIWLAYGDNVVSKLLAGAEYDGTPIELKPTPQARNAEPYQGRPACAGNSSCVPICPIGAKYDATVHVEEASKLGVEVRSRAVVSHLEGDGNNKVSKVHYLDWTAKRHEVTGKTIVLACHAVETPKILLNSAATLPMRSEAVGKYLMDHPQGYAGGTLPEPVFPFRGPPTTSGIDVFRDGKFRSERGAFRMSIGNDGLGRISPINKILEKHIDSGLFGDDLNSALKSEATRILRISYSTEMLPMAQNTVTLSTTRFDELGIPKPDLHFELDDYSYDAFAFCRKLLKFLFDKMGATNFAYKTDDPKEYSGAGHIMGTTRMGSSIKTSVVDGACRSHDYENLYIAGSSVFTTGGTANPTLTVAALALRTADQILKDLR